MISMDGRLQAQTIDASGSDLGQWLQRGKGTGLATSTDADGVLIDGYSVKRRLVWQ